jgi:hypothetical protein
MDYKREHDGPDNVVLGKAARIAATAGGSSRRSVMTRAWDD